MPRGVRKNKPAVKEAPASAPVTAPPAPVESAAVIAANVAAAVPTGPPSNPPTLNIPTSSIIPNLQSLSTYFSAQLQLPPQARTDLLQVLSVMEYGNTRDTVRFFHKLTGVVRFWLCRVRDIRAKASLELSRKDANLDLEARQRINETGGKCTEEMVSSYKHRNAQRIQLEDDVAGWSSIVFQLEAILEDLNVDILVQDSVWDRQEMGLQNVTSKIAGQV